MAFKAVFLLALAFLSVTAQASYMDETVEEKVIYSKVLTSAPAPTPTPPIVKAPTPPPPVVKPPPPPAPPVVKPPTPPPPVYKPPPPTPPIVKPPPPSGPSPPVVKPPTPVGPVTPPPTMPPVRTRADCIPLCAQRCKLHSRTRLCNRACMTCCDRCKCVPPGTYGNREKCGTCYTSMTTRRNKPKCP